MLLEILDSSVTCWKALFWISKKDGVTEELSTCEELREVSPKNSESFSSSIMDDHKTEKILGPLKEDKRNENNRIIKRGRIQQIYTEELSRLAEIEQVGL